MDMRIVFRHPPTAFFGKLHAAGLSLTAMAAQAKVSERTIRSWRAADTAMPLGSARRWAEKFNVLIPSHRTIDLTEQRRTAGMLGGAKRQALYGNPGTKEGRRQGGLRALRVHQKELDSPFVARRISRPAHSERLAELIGAVLGDGTLTPYQLVLYSNRRDEGEYAEYLRRLIIAVFGIEPSVRDDRSRGIIRLLCSRKNLVRSLQSLGLGIGNKTKRQARVPRWIERSPAYATACMRGLIDTDGCVYIDRHSAGGVRYRSLGIAFTNASVPLLDFVERQMRRRGYAPTRWGRHVRLRRREDVLRYATEVGFSNPKHARKIRV